MTSPIDSWGSVTVSVRRLSGQGASGPVHAAAVDVTDCDVQGANKLVRTRDGRELVSSVQVWLPASTAAVPEGSLVVLPAPWSRTTTVLQAVPWDSGGTMPADMDHTELLCE